MLKRLNKPIAILTLMLILFQIFTPTLSFALTSGPTAPEATSFEPIDTTDMVNPLTGDFTYNMPLLEVPGPEGGYPLSLSYHAGIQPNEEASWVGLGWTLNPGAISRNVNGYPDDFKDVNNTVRSYWNGGSTKTVGVDVGFGMGVASVNFGLEFSQDTYKGFGIGASIGGGAGIKGTPFNIGVSVGTSASGENYAGLNIGVSTGEAGKAGMRLGVGVNLSTNFESLNAGAGGGISYSNGNNFNTSLLGASISSRGKASFSVGGVSASVNNANAGKIQTESSGWSFSIPLPIVSIGISSNYVRYWSDETANVATSGSIYAPVSPGDLNDHAYDTYRLLNPNRANIVDYPDPDRLIGGTFPDFDNYSITAQGLSGNIRPYSYQSVVYKQNVINNSDHSNDVTARIISSNKTNPAAYAFRFVNDFSNSYRQGHSNPTMSDFNFDDPNYGDNDGDYGFDHSKNELGGSKSVKYFTNEQINSSYAKSQGFCNYYGNGYSRDVNAVLDKQIGGFMVTNESGVTYHYALPAYSSLEEVYSEKISRAEGYKFNKLSRPNKYAYTWFLTAITGPDYVDRNNDGAVNKDDWGYWVKFDYGKWSSYYSWRNPSEGFHKDIDSDFQSYSSGVKDVYYLNTIRTRSHVAIFEKADRADSKSINEASISTSGGPSTDNQSTVSSLKLSRIYLIKSEDYDALNGSGTNPDFPDLTVNGLSSRNNVPDLNFMSATLQSRNNVIDDKDLLSIYESLKQKSIRSIKFNYDYSLCNGVPNSFDPNGDRYSNINTTGYPRLGKLSLLSVESLGKNESFVSAPTEFEYDIDPTLSENQDGLQISDVGNAKRIRVITQGKFHSGDIIRFTYQNNNYYCVLLSQEGEYFYVKYIGSIPNSATSGVVECFKTKNPPYNKDAVDIWGMFKSDFNAKGNENLDRMPTEVSNSSCDVWSLRKIRTQLGADINISYEGDDYNQSVLNKSRALVLTDFDNNSQRAQQNLVCTVNYPNGNIRDYLKEDDKVSLILLKKEYLLTQDGLGKVETKYSVVNSSSYGDQIVRSINGNQLVIHYTDAFYNEIIRKTSQAVYSDFPTIRVGNIGVSNRVNKYFGGGIRVKQIEVNSMDGQIKQTKYSYKAPIFNNQSDELSSGVTAFEPYLFDIDNVRNYIVNNPVPNNPYLWVQDTPQKIDEAVRSFRRELYKDMNYLLGISRELPSPGIMYEYVSVEDVNIGPDGTVSTNGGKSTFQYQVFNAGMIGKKEYNYQESANTRLINMSLKNYTSRIGNLKRIITYDNKGNKLTEIINHYLHDPIAEKSFETQVSNYDLLLANYRNQGVIQERYGDARTIMENGAPMYKTIMSGRDFYPTIQIGTTQIDYKNRTRVKQENLAFDFYNGMVTKTLAIDSYGNRFITEVTPAYRFYPAMGLKVNENVAGNRKNMISQEAVSKTYQVNTYNQPIGIVSATATSWSTENSTLDPWGDITTTGQANIWRKSGFYSWLSNGISSNNMTPINEFQDFFNGGSGNPNWKKTGQITLYNVFSKALETADLYNIHSATKMGYNNSKVILAGNPAKYNEIAYSGAEDSFYKGAELFFGGNIRLGTASLNSGIAHTGTKSLSLSPGANGFVYSASINSLQNNRNYVVSAWVRPADGDISGAKLYYQVDNGNETYNTPSFQKQAAGWYLLEMTIPANAVNGGYLKIGIKNTGSNTFYADDFRFQPLNAVTSAFVYDAVGQLSHILDNNNMFLKFEYDNAGRLIKTFKEVLGKANTPLIKEYAYNYGKMNKPFWKNTGNSRCEQVNGVLTGYQENEQKDNNPGSVSFNQVRWTKSNVIAQCLPTVYVKLVPSYTNYPSYTEGVFTAKFYSDWACIMPVSIQSSLTLNYRMSEDFSGVNSQHNDYHYSISIPPGELQYMLANYVTSQCSVGTNQNNNGSGHTQESVEIEQPPIDDGSCVSRNVVLTPGPGYTIVY